MVHVFSKSIDDSHLAFPNLTTTYVDIERVLREEEAVLPERYSKTGYKGVIDEFEAQRWAFYPAMDVLRMGEVNIEEKSILPFFYSAPINVGGTAHVHHFKVDVDLVEHPELRAALEPSRKTDTAIGSEVRFKFARTPSTLLKTFHLSITSLLSSRILKSGTTSTKGKARLSGESEEREIQELMVSSNIWESTVVIFETMSVAPFEKTPVI